MQSKPPKQDTPKQYTPEELKRLQFIAFYGSNTPSTGGLTKTTSDVLVNPVIQTLQPVSDILRTFQQGYFWLNVGGIIVGLILTVISIEALLKGEIIGAAKGLL